MNVYLEDAKLSQTLKHIKIFEKTLPSEELLNFHIISKRKLKFVELIIILQRFKRISSIEFITEPQNLSSALIKFINANKKVGIVFVTKRELNKKTCEKIALCKGIVRIYDLVNQSFALENMRNVLVAREDNDEIRKADVYNLISKDNPIFQCVFSSCLGHTLYVAKNGDVSFCPKYAEKSKIGTLDNIENIFDNETFRKCLKESFEHRSSCKQSCKYFDKCKGGCPFEDTCGYFVENYCDAEEELLQLEKNETDLSTVRLYKELALLNKLCAKIRNK